MLNLPPSFLASATTSPIVLPGKRRMRQQRDRHRGDQSDRREVLARIEAGVGVEGRVDRDRAGVAEEQRIAVRRAADERAGADDARAADAVVDDHLMAEQRRRASPRPRARARRRRRPADRAPPASRCGSDSPAPARRPRYAAAITAASAIIVEVFLRIASPLKNRPQNSTAGSRCESHMRRELRPRSGPGEHSATVRRARARPPAAPRAAARS